MVYLEYQNTRFWRCEHTSTKTVTTSYGKCDSNGRTVVKTDFETDDDALEYVEKMSVQKRSNGYSPSDDPKTKNNDDSSPNTVATRASKKRKKGAEEPVVVAVATDDLTTTDSSTRTKKRVGAVIDPEVERIDEGLASRAEVYECFSGRLILVDPSKNMDKYYILQLLIDSKANKKPRTGRSSKNKSPKQFYVYSRWGATGTKGRPKLDGPFDFDTAKTKFCKVFRSKTGIDWDEADNKKDPIDGKYEFLPPFVTNLGDDGDNDAKWYYYLTCDPLGKPNGWYEYDSDNTAQTEALYGDYEECQRAARFSTRLVQSSSSGFTYRVDLESLIQTNTNSGTSRPIGRTTSGLPPTTVPDNKTTLTKSLPKLEPVMVSNVTCSTRKSPPTTAKKFFASSESNAVAGDVDTFVSHSLQTGSIYGDYDVMLNQTNLDANNNKFYKIQLIKAQSGVYLFTRWGRVGEDGRLQELGPMDSTKAIKEFEMKFKTKTANKWQDRDDFEPRPRLYTIVEMEKDSSAAKSMTDRAQSISPKSSASAAKVLPCKIEADTKHLIDLIFDEDMFNSAMSDMNLDPAKLPLGALSKAQIAKGFEKLELVENEINGAANATELMRLTSDFYTIVPHAFGRKQGPVLSTQASVNDKYEMLNTLGDIEMAQSMQAQNQSTTTETTQAHPSDLNYQQLATDLEFVTKQDQDYKMIQKYFTNTKQKGCNYMKLNHIWRANRHGESERFSAHAGLDNRKLLWHGTSVAVVAAILKSGLRIMPHSGGRVGKGIYLADQHAKSAGYVGSARGKAIMFLVEAALGKQHDIVRDDSSLVAAPDGFDSVLAKGREAPNERKDVEVDIDGNVVCVPQGPPVNVKSASNSSFYHNEFLVYKESQHRIRYVLSFDI